MHHRRKAVVGGLRAVDVVVRMHRRFRSERPSEALIGTVRDHFVRIHVGLRAGSRLPDRKRKVGIEPPLPHLFGGSLDRCSDFDVEDTQTTVGTSGGELLQPEGADQRDGKTLLPDREKFQSTLRLRTPISVGGNLDVAEQVALNAKERFRARHWAPVTPAALMIGPHLSISARRWAASAAGLARSAETGSAPSCARRSLTTPSSNAALKAPTSLSITGFGVPFGANRPY